MGESAVSVSSKRPNVRLIGLLGLGHMVVDMYQGALPALLPSLRVAHSLSYAAVGTLVLVTSITSSVIQPIFGYLVDRRATSWMLPVSVFLAGLGLSLVGIAPTYSMVVGLLVVMGIGVASFHPLAYKTAASVAGEKRATAISWFSVGGNAGNSFGPPVVASLLAIYGLRGSLGMLPAALLMAALMSLVLPRLSSSQVRIEKHAAGCPAPRTMYGAVALLILIVALRSWAQLGFMTFLPFYYVDYLSADQHSVGIALFVFLGGGVLGTLVGGPLADRWGARRFMQWGFLVAAPLGVLFLLSRGAVALLVLGLFGGVLISTFTITVVLGQSYLPGNTGLAAGLIVGFAIGTGGVAVTLLGWIADHFGLLIVLWIAAIMPLACFLAAIYLPVPREESHS
ncbi:MAG: fosmidomycin resistance protein [Acidobacteria bacterium]|nr:fosmidomycin resistance protein [Acidobacteriota bacterium]